ncbi:MAG TPA: hypothetical protein VE078_18030 [Thermoanaerobaculia bacterium]|nr:hypothetical protein [Thermoanaerobaculia bacterium]
MRERTDAEVDPDKRLLFVLLRYSMDLDQTSFAAAAHISASQVSLYDRGLRTVPDAVLQRAADARGFPQALITPALRAIRSFRLAADGWSRADRVLADTFLPALLALGEEALEAVAATAGNSQRPWPEAGDPLDREAAAELWLRLERRNTRQRLMLVEETEEFRGCALCERVAAASIEIAASNPAEALERAELALSIAQLSAAKDTVRWRAEGYAWFHVSMARRVTSDLPGADVALSTARRLWEAGAPGDPGFFDEAIVLALEADLHREPGQKQFFDLADRLAQSSDLKDQQRLKEELARLTFGE